MRPVESMWCVQLIDLSMVERFKEENEGSRSRSRPRKDKPVAKTTSIAAAAVVLTFNNLLLSSKIHRV